MGRKNRNKNKRKNRNRGNNGISSEQLASCGPRGTGTTARTESVQLRRLTTNLVAIKKFRFLLGSGVAEGTTYSISAAKLCALTVMGVVSNITVYQFYRSVRVVYIEGRTTVSQTSGLFTPRDFSVEFAGTGNGQQGNGIKTSNMSVGATAIGAIRYTPDTKVQAAQWQDGSTTSPPLLFSITAGGGSILDIVLDLVVTGDIVSNRSVTVSTCTPGQIYWLALDNNAGGNLSTSNNWTPMPNLLTTT